MPKLNRRAFLIASLGGLMTGLTKRQANIFTVNGAIAANQLGKALVHEHFLVDFIGADKINEDLWNPVEVAATVLPYLQEVKQAGVKSIFDCTPAFLGRDVRLLQLLAQKSGLQIITNTGYYGARENKFLPPWAFSETADQLAQRWITEFQKGIADTTIRPGFIKIGVDGQAPLTEIHQKLVRAAALTHLATGLTIFSHTGPGQAAFEQINILQQLGVKPDAFVWVHAQNEQDKSLHIKAASQSAWVSLDGIGWGDFENYVDSLVRLKTAGLLHRVLISHDAGWYKPQEAQTNFQGYTNIFKELFPRLKQKGFTDKDFEQLLVKNPATAMSIRVKKL